MSVGPHQPQAFLDARLRLRAWLFEAAWPMWWMVGGDRIGGGFYERINMRGEAVEAPRRIRVVGRQVYAYAVAARHGWGGGAAEEAVAHGVTFLLEKGMAPDGRFYCQVAADGTPIESAFDLYDQAFALFGLAAAAGIRPWDRRIGQIASSVRETIIAGWRHPSSGFEESRPRTLPLKANPHMHMLEASLAWIEAGAADDGEWRALSDEIALLCLNRFLHPQNGALREFFDGDWHPLTGDLGRVVEPGHQYEWAYLLKRWGELNSEREASGKARRLVEIAEKHGICPARKVVFAEIHDDLSPRDERARLWPQTERIKAWVIMAELAKSEMDWRTALDTIVAAADGLMMFLQTPVKGIYYDVLRKDGTFVDEDAKASSLYHIVCAYEAMERLAERLAVLGSTGGSKAERMADWEQSPDGIADSHAMPLRGSTPAS